MSIEMAFIIIGLFLSLASAIGALAIWILSDIRDTLKGQAAHVTHIDSRVSHMEGILEVKHNI